MGKEQKLIFRADSSMVRFIYMSKKKAENIFKLIFSKFIRLQKNEN